MVDVSDYYVTPGLIDIHTHFDSEGDALSLNPDQHSLRNGVTTAVDAGSSGWKTFEEFKTKVIDESTTRVLAWVNIVGAGMSGGKIENDPAQMDAEAAARVVQKYPQIVWALRRPTFSRRRGTPSTALSKPPN